MYSRMNIEEDASPEAWSQTTENYALNMAMDEAKKTPLLNREEALAYLSFRGIEESSACTGERFLDSSE